MRTTVDLDEDVLLAAREVAGQRGVSIGRVISDLVRQALSQREAASIRNGVPLIPIQPGAVITTLELVNKLRDETP